MRCRLCGYEFDPAGMACHAACPLGSHCNLICCPHCGYQVVDESRSWLARLVRSVWPADTAEETRAILATPPKKRIGVPLSHIPVGMQVKVQYFDQMSALRLARISGFGLIPGSIVEILQRTPTPVIRFGETELALDMEIMAQIWVDPQDAGLPM